MGEHGCVGEREKWKILKIIKAEDVVPQVNQDIETISLIIINLEINYYHS